MTKDEVLAMALCTHLLPCPFCGEYPHKVVRKVNPRASCKTEGCIASKLPVINLDSKESIDAWNTRLIKKTP